MEENNPNLAKTIPDKPLGHQSSNTNSFWDFVRYAVVAAAIIIPFRIFIAQPYIVEGASSYPTFKDGDYLIVDQLSKRFDDPKRQEFFIIRYPKDPSKFFIKRMIGLPHDRVVIKQGEVWIYNDEHKDGLKLEEPYVVLKKTEDFSAELGDNEYFVMGDNRAGSSDSRVWGTLPKEDIVGRPFLRLFPLNEIGVWPGALQ